MKHMKHTLTAFESTPEFTALKVTVGKLLKVSKAKLERRVAAAKEASPRKGQPESGPSQSCHQTRAQTPALGSPPLHL